MLKNKIIFILVLSHTHRDNAAERSIQTFKKHFKADIASLDLYFSIFEWDQLFEQDYFTLNLLLLQPARVNQKLSGYAYIFGQFDILAPPGINVLVHLKPQKQGTWDFNRKEGWYIGPSIQHYCCMKYFMPTT